MVDGNVAAEMRDQHIPGLALAVLRDGKPTSTSFRTGPPVTKSVLRVRSRIRDGSRLP
jgi:hypothetical protein